MLFSCYRMLMKIISDTETHVTILANADPKMAYVPFWLLNLCTKQFGPLLFQLLRSNSSNLNEEYLNCIAEKPGNRFCGIKVTLTRCLWGSSKTSCNIFQKVNKALWMTLVHQI